MTKYRDYAKFHNLPIVFAGFRQQEELPRYYAAADIFVFPTRTDPWGLVLNEAMSCALPVIASAAAGAVDDLVKPGVNGFVHMPGDIDALAQHIETLLNSPDMRQNMGNCLRRSFKLLRLRKVLRGLGNVILRSNNG